MTDPLGQSQVIPYLVGLSRKGYQFILVSFEKQERFRKDKLLIEQKLEKYQIQWVPLCYHKKPPILSTLYDLYFLKKIVWRLHRQHQFQIIHCRSYLTALIGMNMKKKLGVKFIFDMRGFWADERVEGGIWNINNPLYKAIFQYFKAKEKELLNAADYTITLTHKAKGVIHGWEGIASQPIPIQVIPCCVDEDFFDPDKVDIRKQERLRNSLGITKAQFVLTYLGSLGTWYMVEEMLLFFKELLAVYPDAKFLIVTQDKKAIIDSYSKKLKIEEGKIIFASASREEVPLYVSLSTASIFFIKPVFSKQASSATKMGEIMSMGIPLITNSGIGDADKIMADIKIDKLVSTFDKAGYAVTTEQLKDVLDISTQTIREGAKKYFSLERGVESYRYVYQNVLINS